MHKWVEKTLLSQWESIEKAWEEQGSAGEGKGKEKGNQAALERRQWREWCSVMSMYLTESGKITKYSNILVFFALTFHFHSSSYSLNYSVKNEHRNDWVMRLNCQDGELKKWNSKFSTEVRVQRTFWNVISKSPFVLFLFESCHLKLKKRFLT